MSKLCVDGGSRNQVVSDIRTFHRFSIYINCCVDSEQVDNFDYRDIQRLTYVSSVPGELPPSPPRIFFGRDQLIEKIVHLAENLTPIALIGAGGIGKTSLILTVLHDERVEQRFGEYRRFIRCDEFPATRNHFLSRLSQVIGAGIENPENLTSLRRSLSSKKMLIVLDNAESILDPQGPNAREIYTDVDELTRSGNICLCITSRISAIPPDCEVLEIPTLATEAAHQTFHRIYNHDKRSDAINDILSQLDFHPLSITLLATIAQQNKWGTERLITEWEKQRTGVLHTQHSKSFADTIELSLASPMFQELGHDARSLLEVIAFLPQGVNEKNVSWLFPTISNVLNTLDGFCTLSLTYRNNGFVTMLAPLRDHLRPKDPASSPLLITTKERYFAHLSGEVSPGKPGFEEARWITTEDVNVEHLLDIFTTLDKSSESIRDVCVKFMAQLYWHKPRLVTLGPKIEALPDKHPSKPRCLTNLSRLFDSVGNFTERKRLLSRSLKLWREQGNDLQVAQTLRSLSGTNRQIGLREEGIRQAKEASEILERLGSVGQQAKTLVNLAWALCDSKKLDAAEEAGSRAIDLLPKKGEELWVCRAHRVLGKIHRSKGETEKAICHLETALGIASSLNAASQMFWVNFVLAEMFAAERKFGKAHTHFEQTKFLAANNTYLLARASVLQARLWYAQDLLGEAKSEALRALDVFEELGAVSSSKSARRLLQQIDARRPGQSDHS